MAYKARKTPYNLTFTGPQRSVITYKNGSQSASETKTGLRSHLLEVSGVLRKKPSTEFVPPTPYFLRKIDELMAFGRQVKRNTTKNAPLWQWNTEVISGCLQNRVGNQHAGSGVLARVLGFNPETQVPSWTIDRAIMKARVGLKGEFNAALFVAEWSETNRYVHGKVMEMVDEINKFVNHTDPYEPDPNTLSERGRRRAKAKTRRARRRGAGRLVGNTASQWLELRYALMPILLDAYAATEAFAKLPLPYFLVVSKGSQREKVDLDHEEKSSSGSSVLFKVKGTYGCDARIDALPSNMPLLIMQQFGVTNPAEVAWEKARLSFIVDWWFPIGNFLSQFDALLGYSVKGFSQSEFTKLESVARGVGTDKSTSGGGAISSEVDHDWVSSKSIVRLNRTTSNEVPFARPRFYPKFRGERVVDAIALLHQAFAKTGLGKSVWNDTTYYSWWRKIR